MNGVTSSEQDDSEFVEVDPTGRYGRYNEVLGKGASKTVYRAFDEYEGIEVAWNQVKFNDFLQSSEDLERLFNEINLLKTLKHTNIMKFYTSWVDNANRHINFVTEMFTSGTLRQYRQKHKKVNIRAVKHWCRQILEGLLYLHSHNPPIIHRDLKCDNIFVNGNQGEVKIGDLGLAAILCKSHAAHCVEFMAPEVYEEQYNELVDIYAFGMCILEMVTFEYPYSECFYPAQIYKKVVSGKKPDSLYKVKDPDIRQFIEKCLATVSCRLPAKELLNDPFLRVDDYGSCLAPVVNCRGRDGTDAILRQPLLRIDSNSLNDPYFGHCGNYEPGVDLEYIPPDFESNETEFMPMREDEHLENVDITIKGKREDDGGIFLRLRMDDKEGRVRNIYFPFDMESDTALSVASEMVLELDITDQELTKIADMINGEIILLVPEWNRGLVLGEECPDHTICGNCHNCASNGPYLDYVSPSNPCVENLQVIHCSTNGYGAMHGRFEEIMYQYEASEQCVTEGAPVVSSQSAGTHYELSLQGSDNDNEQVEESCFRKDEKVVNVDKERDRKPTRDLADDYENEIRQELRWLKAKYQMQMRELRDQQIRVISRNTSFSQSADEKKERRNHQTLRSSTSTNEDTNNILLRKIASAKHFNFSYANDNEKNWANERVKKYDAAAYDSYSPEDMVKGKSFYTEVVLPQSLHRATSLPVDAVYF